MKIKFEKINYENIFDESYKKMNNNNILDLNKGIAIIYASNGTGKTSFCNLLKSRNESQIKYLIENKVNSDCFYIINNFESRNNIIKKEMSFLIGDKIKKEYEIKTSIELEKKEIFDFIKTKNPFKGIITTNITSNFNNPSEYIQEKELNNLLIEIDNELYTKIEKFKNDKNILELSQYLTSQKKQKITKNIFEFNNKYIDILKKLKELNKEILIKELNKEVTKKNESLKCYLCKEDERKKLQKNLILNWLKPQVDNSLILFREIFSILENFGYDYLNLGNNLNIFSDTKDIEILNNIEIQIIDEIKNKYAYYKNLLIDRISNIEIQKYKEYEALVKSTIQIEEKDYLVIKRIIENNIERNLVFERSEYNNNIVLKLGNQNLLGAKIQELFLSTGEQNFISLCFELLLAKHSKKEIIVLDDPISSLDSYYRNKIIDIMDTLITSQKKIILTHNLELIKLVKYQIFQKFNLYFFCNTPNEKNGFIKIDTHETDLLINISKFIIFLKNDKLVEIKNMKLFLISLIPFMRGYAQMISNKNIYTELTELMHYNTSKQLELKNIFKKLFPNKNINLEGIESITVEDILTLDINKIEIFNTNTKYKLLDKVLKYNLTYLFLRLNLEKKIKIEKGALSNLKLGQLILEAFPEKLDYADENNEENRLFFLSRKALINIFAHYENDLNIFQPAIDISDSVLLKEKNEILKKINLIGGEK